MDETLNRMHRALGLEDKKYYRSDDDYSGDDRDDDKRLRSLITFLFKWRRAAEMNWFGPGVRA